MWFRTRKNEDRKAEEAAPVAVAEPVAPIAMPVPPAEAPPPVGGMLAARLTAPMKSQASSSDVRSERLFRKVKSEVDALRSTIDALHAVPEELTTLDLDEVMAHPEAAAALPPAVLVRALIESRGQNRRLLRRLGKSESRNGRLSAKVRRLKAQRAYHNGRTETLDHVIAALHDNLSDLRLQRDLRGELGPAPVPLYTNGSAGVEALPVAEHA